MANILSQQSKNQVRREYRLRFTIITTVLLSITAVVTILLLVPSYLVLLSRESSLAGQVDASGTNGSQEAYVQSEKVLEQTAQKLEVETAALSITDVIDVVVGSAPEGVSLTGVSLARETAGESEDISGADEIITVAVSGVASTRDGLLQFRDQLERSNTLTQVELPVSYLARDRNVDFNLSVRALVSNPAQVTE